MNRFLKAIGCSAAAAAVLLGACTCAAEDAAEKIHVTVNGENVEFDLQEPVIRNGRTLVPLRNVLEKMGAYVRWNEEGQSIYVYREGEYASLAVGSSTMYAEDGEKTLDAAPEIMNGRTMLPIRAVAEALGATVDWDDAGKTVVITDTFGDYRIGYNYVEDTVKSADGKTDLISTLVSYPTLISESEDSYAAEVSAKLKAEAEGLMAYMLQGNLESAQEWYDSEKTDPDAAPFVPYEFSVNFDIRKNSDGLLSVEFISSYYLGGAHPNSTVTAKSYDMKNKKELLRSDVFEGTDGEINEQLRLAFEAEIDSKPEEYFADAKKVLAENIGQLGFWLDEDGVVIYADTYILASYAAGLRTCTIGYENTKLMKSENSN